MTNTFTQARADLAAILADAGIAATDFRPERINPPIALVTADSPWAAAGASFGSYAVRYAVTLVAPKAPNDAATDALDGLVATAVVALANSPDWGVDRVDEPFMLVVAGAEYLAASLTAVLTTAIETD